MAKRERVCPIAQLGECDVKRVEVDGVAIAVVRVGEKLYAIGDRCSHQDVSLSEGELYCEDLEIECYKHGSTFSLLDGRPISLPATKPVPTFEVGVEDGEVWVALP